MKNIVAINGSPRKDWNTAKLVKEAAAAAQAKGAQVELVHLYDLNYKGCVSCFACKIKGGPSYGRCAVKDGLTPTLDKVYNADGLIIGSPFYLGTETGETHSFLERLMFSCLRYSDPPETLFPKKIRCGYVFTFGANEDMVMQRGWDKHLASTMSFTGRILGEVRAVCSYDTYQFDDYSKYDAPRFDVKQKEKVRQEQFPRDLHQASQLGAWVASA